MFVGLDPRRRAAMTEVYDGEGHVTIDEAEYEQLQKDSEFLRNLQDAGVDNWEGYHYGWTGFGDDE